MSEQENLRIVQEGYAAFGRGDVAAALSNYADDIDWAMPGSPDVVPYAGRRRGREQVAQFYATFPQTEEVEQMDLQDFIAQGDKVLVFGHYKGRVKSTGRSYTKDFIHVVTLRDGKVISSASMSLPMICTQLSAVNHRNRLAVALRVCRRRTTACSRPPDSVLFMPVFTNQVECFSRAAAEAGR